MTDFLVFTLYAPLSSWGDTAVGEVRSSWDRPSRSAILGIVAAALGLLRTDQAGHEELDAMCGIGVRIALRGFAFTDYHTAQDPTGVSLRRFKPTTRRAALDCADPVTSLSQRTLRQDALSIVALWQRHSSTRSLSELATAMGNPQFVLYAGRKANVLGLPLGARILAANTLAAALRDVPPLPSEMERLKPRDGWGREVSHDRCDEFEAGLSTTHTVVRRDARPHRTRWQFAEREVRIGTLTGDYEA
ncbi:MAG: type I-E CRISPR-associated protein Cas5/CasD [bacterium]